jgi:cystathionine beta-lyase/cystathionine gamma-synthase
METLAVHAGQRPDPATGAIMTPIYQTSTFVQEAVGRNKGYDYARSGNPTRSALEACLAALEGGTYGVCSASGLAAIDAVLRLLQPGQHVVAGDDVYGGTYRLFTQVLARAGLRFDFVDMTDLEAVDAALQPDTRLLWLETPTNPRMKVADLAALVGIARAHQGGEPVWVAVDNTFASPAIQQPLRMGADLVVHSTTKYLGGHSDILGGAVVTSDPDLYERLAFLQKAVGAVPGPMDCFLALRGIKTLPLRMERHSRNALQIARFLADHPAVQSVAYPGLEDHPQHQIARKQMAHFGGMLSFLPAGGEAAARAIAERTRLFALAVSLGGVESLIELPAQMTHATVAGSELAVDPALVRLSVGIEHVDDLIDDLAQALEGATR